MKTFVCPKPFYAHDGYVMASQGEKLNLFIIPRSNSYSYGPFFIQKSNESIPSAISVKEFVDFIQSVSEPA